MTRAISLRHRGLVRVTRAISNELQRQAERERFGPVPVVSGTPGGAQGRSSWEGGAEGAVPAEGW